MIIDGQTRDEHIPEDVLDTLHIHRGLVFATHDGTDLDLDLYLPATATYPLPCVLAVPGGGFKARPRETFAAFAGYFAANGFASAAIAYPGDDLQATPAT
mgnify:FL=1